jgi:protein SCO1/2
MSTFAVGLGLIALAGVAACKPGSSAGSVSPDDPTCFARLWPPNDLNFSLTSQTGQKVTQDAFKGHATLVFFGFTHCPNFCPTTMAKLGAVSRRLPEGTPQPKILFVSVDPERDTPELLAQYVTSNGFPPDVTAVTGTEEEIRRFAEAFHATFSRSEDPDSASGYLVDHTTLVYMMDRDWKLRTYFWPQIPPDDMARCIGAVS